MDMIEDIRYPLRRNIGCKNKMQKSKEAREWQRHRLILRGSLLMLLYPKEQGEYKATSVASDINR